MSRMSTTCPNCALHLAVTAADLRVGQGYVRCGRCERVFNALISLAEDPDVAPEAGDVATGTTTLPALEAREAPATEEPAEAAEPTSGQEIVAAAFEPAQPEPEPDLGRELQEDLLATVQTPRGGLDDEMDVIETVATGTFETIVLEGDGVLQTEEMVDEAELDEALQEIAEQIGVEEFAQLQEHIAGGPQATPAEAPASAREPAPDIAPETALAASHAADVPAPDDLLPPAPPRPHRGWLAGAVALGLLLVAQVIHHNRQALVATAPGRALLAPLYGLFGADLSPRWDLAAYDVRQLGGEALPDMPGHILLRATVLNRALHAQPPPLLRVTLQDRFGNALAHHDVAPQDYMPSPPPARLAPDQRLDAELLLADPGNRAVGFELDACLPDAAGRAHCASRP